MRIYMRNRILKSRSRYFQSFPRYLQKYVKKHQIFLFFASKSLSCVWIIVLILFSCHSKCSHGHAEYLYIKGNSLTQIVLELLNKKKSYFSGAFFCFARWAFQYKSENFVRLSIIFLKLSLKDVNFDRRFR